MQTALEHLELLGQADPTRWQQLVKLLLLWAVFRRPSPEHGQVLATVRSSHHDVMTQREVETMLNQLKPTYEQELVAHGLVRGRSEGKAEAYREMLLDLLRERFGAVADELAAGIATAEPARLQAALHQLVHVEAIEDLPLQ